MNLISRRAKMEGFLSLDCWDRFPEVAAQLGTWVAEGSTKWRAHVFDGLESAPDALNAMFTGANTGKIIVRLTAHLRALWESRVHRSVHSALTKRRLGSVVVVVVAGEDVDGAGVGLAVGEPLLRRHASTSDAGLGTAGEVDG